MNRMTVQDRIRHATARRWEHLTGLPWKAVLRFMDALPDQAVLPDHVRTHVNTPLGAPCACVICGGGSRKMFGINGQELVPSGSPTSTAGASR